MLDEYERKMLEGWEDVSKRGQLTLWIMLALKDGPKHMNDVKQFIEDATEGLITADDKSMYRALRRYAGADLVSYTSQPGKGGPELKVYSLTQAGKNVLDAFIDRNIIKIFFKPELRKLLEG